MKHKVWVVAALAAAMVSNICAQGQQLIAPQESHNQVSRTETIARNEPANRPKVNNRGRSESEMRSTVEALRKRRAALERYLQTVSPTSSDYGVTERAIR